MENISQTPQNAPGTIISSDSTSSPDEEVKSIVEAPMAYEQKLEICRDCHFFNNRKKICSQCGCSMQLKYIEHFKSCPIGKW
jgi:hypothetical protein